MTNPSGLAFCLWILALPACSLDPVHEAAVEALGPEDPRVPVGQYHRQGQPCVVCHSAEGPAKTVFSVAGTIFYGPPKPGALVVGVNAATVNLVDDVNNGVQSMTNCVGNFFMTPSEFNPTFPMEVTVQLGDATAQPMHGHIGREPSCANCHYDVKGNPGISNVGHVYWSASAPAATELPSCPVSPIIEGGS